VRLLLLAHGPSVHTRRWARALAARGHEIRLLTADPDPSSGLEAKTIGRAWPVAALRYASGLGAVRDELRAFRPDATLAHFVPNYGFLAALAGARPLVVVPWGSDLLVNAGRTLLHRARVRYTLRRADLVHVDAEVLAEAAVALGAEPARVWCRAWGVDDAAFAPPRPAARAGAPGPLRVLWTRHLEPVYDPLTFIDALGLLRKRGVPFQALLAGEGSLRPDVEARIAREEVASGVTLLGMVPAERLRQLYHEGDLYVSLSRSDSTSQSLLEAMAARLFPIVSDIPGNREWITHRRHGYLVPVGDAEATACALLEAARDPHADEIRERAFRDAVARARFSETVSQLEARLRALAS